jgi:hypothetical protein
MKKIEMRKIVLLVIIAMFSITGLMAQNASADKYREVVTGRADKIVQTLNVKDSATYYSVRERIAEHYISLNKLYSDRDTLLKMAKASTSDKTLLEVEKKKIEAGTTEQVAKIHKSFVADLSKHLTEEQVSKVKDGLTYNVLNVTYTAYLDMIPTLTKPQKDQIYAWLLEAREYAMDAESSDKKHAWFGKYKGRINNYLSAQGYDLQAERAAWEKRIAEKKEKGN